MSKTKKAPKPTAPRGTLQLFPEFLDMPTRKRLTPQDIRKSFAPARTLGASEEVRLAMDEQLAESGAYTLLEHSFEMGYGATSSQFLGYGFLQGLAQNGLIRACISTVADDMTRAWIELTQNDSLPATSPNGQRDPDKTAQESVDRQNRILQAMESLGLQRTILKACELVGYEGGAFIFIDTGVQGEDLKSPLNISRYSSELQPGKHLRFAVIDPVNIFPGDYNSANPLAKDYFQPKWWWVLGQPVHASRLIRLVANEVPILLRPSYNFLGIPQAQILWDYVMHFQDCRAAEQRLLQKFSLTVLKTDMEGIIHRGAPRAEFDRRIMLMLQNMSNDGVLAIDRETEDLVKLETPLGGVSDIVRQSLEMLAAINRTPAVKLLGISPSGFNATGESDIRNYYDHVRSQQEKVLRDGITTILKCIQLHLFGEINRGISFNFKELGSEDRAALGMYQQGKAQTIGAYVDRDIISPEEARKALSTDPDSGFSDIDPEDTPEEPDDTDNMLDSLDNPETGTGIAPAKADEKEA